MQLQQSQLSESANQASQPVLSAIQPASQSASPQPPKSAQFPPTTCSCSRVSQQASQPAHTIPRVPSFLQQHAVAAKSAQRVSWPSRPGSQFCQPASQQASSQSTKSVKFPPTTCSCSQVSLTSQPARLASQFCQPASKQASQPAHNLPRVPSFLQQHAAVAAASAQRVS